MHAPKVIRQLKEFVSTHDSLHIRERFTRIEAYKDLISTRFIYAFEVTTGHPNGNEVHAINEHGLIYVYNLFSGKLITIMHPRRPQLHRYFEQLGLPIPAKVETLAYANEVRNIAKGLNDL